jgi:8-oxo-dGTP diphosphatase
MVELSGLERPFVAVDVLVFTIMGSRLDILLVKRKTQPFKGMMALPGGFVGIKEELEEAIMRKLFEETNVGGIRLEQFHTFGETSRDPRGRVITVAYIALMNSENIRLLSRKNTSDAQWVQTNKMPRKLAFDHKNILSDGIGYLREETERGSSMAFSLLPSSFTLSELQRVHEAILGRKLDKRNFRKKILSLGILRSTKEKRTGVHRPAQMYAFRRNQ